MSLLIPKPRRRRRRLPSYIIDATRLGTAEFRALRRIANNSDLLVVDGVPFLLFLADPDTLDVLAGVGAGLEDVECNGDVENDADNEPTLCHRHAQNNDQHEEGELSLGWAERPDQTLIGREPYADLERQERRPERVERRIAERQEALAARLERKRGQRVVCLDGHGRVLEVGRVPA